MRALEMQIGAAVLRRGADEKAVSAGTCGQWIAALCPRLDGDVISDVVRVDKAPHDGRVAARYVDVVHSHVERLVPAQQNWIIRTHGDRRTEMLLSAEFVKCFKYSVKAESSLRNLSLASTPTEWWADAAVPDRIYM